MSQQDLFSPPDAVGELKKHGFKTTTGTLAKWRSEGGGPPFHKIGNRILYGGPSLAAYAQKRIGREFSSTSEARAARASA